jgi:hypothetical protein
LSYICAKAKQTLAPVENEIVGADKLPGIDDIDFSVSSSLQAQHAKFHRVVKKN